MPGRAVLYPASGQSTSSAVAWQAVDPFGVAITLGATTSQGLQEFLNTLAANGWNGSIEGCQPINATTTVDVPVLQKLDVRGYAPINFNVSGCPGLRINSMARSRFIWDAQISYTDSNPTNPDNQPDRNASSAVCLGPHSPTEDGMTGIYYGLQTSSATRATR